MSDDQEHSGEQAQPIKPEIVRARGRAKAPNTAAKSLTVWVVVGIALLITAWATYSDFRIEVPPKHVGILIKKIGLDQKNADEIAPTPKHKGVQREVLTEGRYFRNPFEWDWEIVPQFEVPDGKLGVRLRMIGENPSAGQFLALDDDHKGIVPEVLRPGRYPINPYLETVELHEPVTVPAGFKGVVTNLADPLAEDPNVLTVAHGVRGVERETREPGTYYINPYVTRISLVDCRSQRFNLGENNNDMGFPSKDGFWVSLDGIVEFRVKPEMAAQVYVEYNENTNGDAIDEEVVRKVILPNARSFCRLEGSNSLGREFIEGKTRTVFQANFERRLREACDEMGIEIVQALITTIQPPEKIADTVRKREIAKQQEKQFQQQILQQESEMHLAVEKQLVQQKTALVSAAQDVNSLTIQAEQEQQVAVTKAQEQLVVAKLKLEAARDEAAALVAHGKAAAQVVELDNAAEAAGWNRTIAAYNGNGLQFAQFALFEKLASAYRKIMINTADSPIMKIFETFATGLNSDAPISPTAPVTPTAPEQPAAQPQPVVAEAAAAEPATPAAVP